MKHLNFLKATVVNTFLSYLNNSSNQSMAKYYPPSAPSADSCTGTYGEIAKRVFEDIEGNKSADKRILDAIEELNAAWCAKFVLDIIEQNRRVQPISEQEVELADLNDSDIINFSPIPDFNMFPEAKSMNPAESRGYRIYG